MRRVFFYLDIVACLQVKQHILQKLQHFLLHSYVAVTVCYRNLEYTRCKKYSRLRGVLYLHIFSAVYWI